MSLVRLLQITVLSMLLAACAKPQDRQQGPVILAAASLQGALDEVADAWTAKGHPRPIISYAGTPSLARQVEAGAPADIILTADEQWMDALEQKQHLLPDTRRALLGNTLVLVGKIDGDQAQPVIPASVIASLGTERLAMAAPDSVPAGRYGKEALQSLDLWETVKDRIAPTENVRAAAALVERGEAPLALIYESDLIASDKLIRVADIPPDAQPAIRYPMALLKTASHADAQGFADFLASREAEAIFVRHAFFRLAEL